MIAVLVTQRIVEVSDYDEIRECLDEQWGRFLNECGCVSIPLTYAADIEALFHIVRIGGILLTGGNNLASVETEDPLNRHRDLNERRLIEHAVPRGIPVLGICRGMQMICHYFGAHLTARDNHVRTNHTVVIEPGSRLFDDYGNRHVVNSYHEFAVTEPGAQLHVSGVCAGDSSIEAVEHHHLPITGIMWHPERERPFNSCDVEFVKRFFRNPERP